MLRNLILFLTAIVAFAADNPWAKVKDLKSGTELRIYKTTGKQPILAKMDELTDESLVVVVKNEQVAIPRDQIERIDSRPMTKNSRITTETKTTTDRPTEPVGPRPTPGASVPGTSTSSNVSVGSKPDFDTIYRRTSATK